ncbi:MAG: hypothetical protein MHM6MM_002172 [Cercozoa sp. M6MM]
MPEEYRCFIGNLSYDTRERDLVRYLEKEAGRVVDCMMSRGFAHVEFKHRSDARHAVRELDGTYLDDRRIAVEYARPRGRRYSRSRSGSRIRHSDRDVCYNCGKPGHIAARCEAGDMRGKCYQCGESGHEKRNCPQGSSYGGGYGGGRDRSRDRSRGRDRSRDRSRSHRRSRSATPPRQSPPRDRSPPPSEPTRSDDAPADTAVAPEPTTEA